MFFNKNINTNLRKKISVQYKKKPISYSSRTSISEIENTDTNLYHEFERLLNNYTLTFEIGEKVVGTIASFDKKFVYLDMGLKDYALLPREEVSLTGERAEDIMSVGQTREFILTQTLRNRFQPLASLKALEMDIVWDRARQYLESATILEATVTETIKGGYRVEIGGLKSFLPTSQIHPKNLIRDLKGTSIHVTLIDVDESKNRCVCSNRRAIIAQKDTTSRWDEIKVGNLVQGYIQNVTNFGVFVDLDGITGLLHISQISNDRIKTTDGLFHLGEPIKCMVLAVDKENGRLSLTTKKLERSPGDMIRNRELVMDKADEMALLFSHRVAAAEAAIKASENQNIKTSPDSS